MNDKSCLMHVVFSFCRWYWVLFSLFPPGEMLFSSLLVFWVVSLSHSASLDTYLVRGWPRSRSDAEVDSSSTWTAPSVQPVYYGLYMVSSEGKFTLCSCLQHPWAVLSVWLQSWVCRSSAMSSRSTLIRRMRPSMMIMRVLTKTRAWVTGVILVESIHEGNPFWSSLMDIWCTEQMPSVSIWLKCMRNCCHILKIVIITSSENFLWDLRPPLLSWL